MGWGGLGGVVEGEDVDGGDGGGGGELLSVSFSVSDVRVFSHRVSSGLKADSAFSLYQINPVCIVRLDQTKCSHL